MIRTGPPDHWSEGPLWLRQARARIPLAFVGDAAELYLLELPGSRWAAELLRTGRAALEFPDGRSAIGSVELVADPSVKRRIVARFEGKYGPERFRAWFPEVGRCLRIASGSPPPPTEERYFAWLQQEFDSIADEYDRHIFGNAINRYLRQRSVALLRERFRDAHRLLEIGCGSGTETLELLQAGHSIVAVDISSRMLAVVERKAREEGLADRLEVRQSAARDLDRLLREFGPGSFDGAYSTYGALNCEPSLEPVARALTGLLPVGRAFVAGVYNRWCLFEALAYPIAGRFDRAFARLRSPVPVGRSRFCIDTYPWSVRAFQRQMGPGFGIEAVEGAVVLLPPSDLARYREALGPSPGRWESMDLWFGRRWPFTHLGDHFLVTLRRGEHRGPSRPAPPDDSKRRKAG